MPALPWEDLDAFLSVDDFAVDAVLSLQGGETRQIRVIYDDPYLNAELGEYSADTSDPRANGKMADFQGASRGDTLTITSTGQVFDVLTNPQPDGSGWAVLSLAARDE